MRFSKWILSAASMALILTGCSNDDGGGTPPDEGVDNDTLTDNTPLAYENGILVLNEGNFGVGNASVSFVSENLAEVENGIFSSVNQVDAWGDTGQSMAFSDSLAYIVVNGSQKVEVVNRFTFESISTIGGADGDDFSNPRCMAIANGKGYVTNWGDGTDPEDDFVAVVDLETNLVTNKIPVGEGPERLLVNDNMVYVALMGGFNFNNSITVINAVSDVVNGSISVGDAPNSMQLDEEQNLWVLSGGKPAYTGNETAGQLDKIDLSDGSVTETFVFEPTEHPDFLSLGEGLLYYSAGGDVLAIEVTATVLSSLPIIAGTSFYDMTINKGRLYGTDAGDFASTGSLEVYDLSDNSLVASKEVGVNPGAIYFNQ